MISKEIKGLLNDEGSHLEHLLIHGEIEPAKETLKSLEEETLYSGNLNNSEETKVYSFIQDYKEKIELLELKKKLPEIKYDSNLDFWSKLLPSTFDPMLDVKLSMDSDITPIIDDFCSYIINFFPKEQEITWKEVTYGDRNLIEVSNIKKKVYTIHGNIYTIEHGNIITSSFLIEANLEELQNLGFRKRHIINTLRNYGKRLEKINEMPY